MPQIALLITPLRIFRFNKVQGLLDQPISKVSSKQKIIWLG